MVLCENCKVKIQEKKEKKIEETGEDGSIMTLLLLAGAGVGGYLLWKKYAQPTTGLKRTSSPLIESNQNLPPIQPTTEENKNMIRVD